MVDSFQMLTDQKNASIDPAKLNFIQASKDTMLEQFKSFKTVTGQPCCLTQGSVSTTCLSVQPAVSHRCLSVWGSFMPAGLRCFNFGDSVPWWL